MIEFCRVTAGVGPAVPNEPIPGASWFRVTVLLMSVSLPEAA